LSGTGRGLLLFRARAAHRALPDRRQGAGTTARSPSCRTRYGPPIGTPDAHLSSLPANRQAILVPAESPLVDGSRAAARASSRWRETPPGPLRCLIHPVGVVHAGPRCSNLPLCAPVHWP